MAQQTIGVGSVADDNTGDTIRDAFVKVNANFTELYTDDAGDDGVIPSFSGVANNVIHPFHGFFEKKNGEISKVHWSENGKAELIEKSYGVIKLKNTGIIPWNTEDRWENYVNFFPCTLESENGEKYVQKGEIGIFHFKEIEGERFIPQNLRHEYLIEVNAKN